MSQGEHEAASPPQMMDDSGSASHQNAAQGFVARACDNAEPYLAGGRMIFRRQAEPGRKVPPRAEYLGRRRFHDEHRCADRDQRQGFAPGADCMRRRDATPSICRRSPSAALQLRIFSGVESEKFARQGRKLSSAAMRSSSGSILHIPFAAVRPNSAA